MSEYERRNQAIANFKGWPVTLNELCDSVLKIKKRHVMRAIVTLGMVKTYPESKGKARAPTVGLHITYGMALEVWEWIYMHLEERVYLPNTTSRRVAGLRGCAWVPRWTEPISRTDPLPEEHKDFFAVDRRYTGSVIAERLGVSKFLVSRTGIKLGYRGGRYLRDEAAHIANCILHCPAATKASRVFDSSYRKVSRFG